MRCMYGMMTKNKVYINKFIMYSLGMLFLAVGVTLSIKSNMGVSPINSIPFALSKILQIEMGNVVTVYFCSLVLLQVLILRKEFKIINLLQLFFSTLFGYFVSLSNYIFQHVKVQDHVAVQFIFLAASIVIIALGLLLYLNADIVPMPPEGTVKAVAMKSNGEFSKLKVLFDCCAVVIAILLSVIYLGSLTGIGVGTVLSALLIGKVLGIFMNRWKPALQKLVT